VYFNCQLISVRWLERRNLKRGLAVLLVGAVTLATLGVFLAAALAPLTRMRGCGAKGNEGQKISIFARAFRSLRNASVFSSRCWSARYSIIVCLRSVNAGGVRFPSAKRERF
jgi:hypothetical protein